MWSGIYSVVSEADFLHDEERTYKKVSFWWSEQAEQKGKYWITKESEEKSSPRRSERKVSNVYVVCVVATVIRHPRSCRDLFIKWLILDLIWWNEVTLSLLKYLRRFSWKVAIYQICFGEKKIDICSTYLYVRFVLLQPMMKASNWIFSVTTGVCFIDGDVSFDEQISIHIDPPPSRPLQQLRPLSIGLDHSFSVQERPSIH